ncbi:hypothetical protein KQH50_03240 [bacterium]|nr:hypothetical protein [bacterium]
MNQELKSTSDILEKLTAMDSEDIRLLYEQYSEWSRHLHSEILTIATFGLTVSLGSLTFAFGPSISLIQFIVFGFLNMFFLFICHSFIESIKRQQLNFWAVLDFIEANWKIRDRDTNMYGPLIKASLDYHGGSTGRQRRLLFILTGLIWAISILIKCAETLFPLCKFY